MNGLQTLTGMVHAARPIERRDMFHPGQPIPEGYVAAACQRPGKMRAWLVPTDKPITCKRCSR